MSPSPQSCRHRHPSRCRPWPAGGSGDRLAASEQAREMSGARRRGLPGKPALASAAQGVRGRRPPRGAPLQQLSSGFELSPGLRSYMGKRVNGTTWFAEGWPFFSWILINEAGASMDVSALVNLQESRGQIQNISGVINPSDRTKLNLKITSYNGQISNYTKSAAPVVKIAVT